MLTIKAARAAVFDDGDLPPRAASQPLTTALGRHLAGLLLREASNECYDEHGNLIEWDRVDPNDYQEDTVGDFLIALRGILHSNLHDRGELAEERARAEELPKDRPRGEESSDKDVVRIPLENTGVGPGLFLWIACCWRSGDPKAMQGAAKSVLAGIPETPGWAAWRILNGDFDDETEPGVIIIRR